MTRLNRSGTGSTDEGYRRLLLSTLQVGLQIVDELRDWLSTSPSAGSYVSRCGNHGVLDDVSRAPPVGVLEDVELQPSTRGGDRVQGIGRAFLQGPLVPEADLSQVLADQLCLGDRRVTVDPREVHRGCAHLKDGKVRREASGLAAPDSTLNLAQVVSSTEAVEEVELRLQVQDRGGLWLGHLWIMAEPGAAPSTGGQPGQVAGDGVGGVPVEIRSGHVSGRVPEPRLTPATAGAR